MCIFYSSFLVGFRCWSLLLFAVCFCYYVCIIIVSKNGYVYLPSPVVCFSPPCVLLSFYDYCFYGAFALPKYTAHRDAFVCVSSPSSVFPACCSRKFRDRPADRPFQSFASSSLFLFLPSSKYVKFIRHADKLEYQIRQRTARMWAVEEKHHHPWNEMYVGTNDGAVAKDEHKIK